MEKNKIGIYIFLIVLDNIKYRQQNNTNDKCLCYGNNYIEYLIYMNII